MRFLAKILTAGYLLLPLVGLADSSNLNQAIDSTKSSAKDWGQVAKEKLEQGEAAAKKSWPKIKAETEVELNKAKQKFKKATN